jgi:large subunit ribosomal protein L30
MPNQIKITYIRSAIGRNYHQKRTIRALGFKRLHQERLVADSSSMRGMLSKVARLVTVERITDVGEA